MEPAQDELKKAALNMGHAVDALVAAVVLDPLPRVVRRHLAEALASAARVAGLVEGLSEGLVQVPGEEGA